MKEVQSKRWKKYTILILVFSMAIHNLGLLLRDIPDEVKQNVRTLEKVSKKLCKAKQSVLLIVNI